MSTNPLNHHSLAIGASVIPSVPLMSIISLAGVRLQNILPVNFFRSQTHSTAVNRREPPNGFQPWTSFPSLLAAFQQRVQANPESSIAQFHPINPSAPPLADHECNIEGPASERVTTPVNMVRNIRPRSLPFGITLCDKIKLCNATTCPGGTEAEFQVHVLFKGIIYTNQSWLRHVHHQFKQVR